MNKFILTYTLLSYQTYQLESTQRWLSNWLKLVAVTLTMVVLGTVGFFGVLIYSKDGEAGSKIGVVSGNDTDSSTNMFLGELGAPENTISGIENITFGQLGIESFGFDFEHIR